MSKPIAILDFDVWVDCPKCEASLDLTDEDDGSFTTPLFNNEWEKLQDWNVYCDNCDHEFQIERVER